MIKFLLILITGSLLFADSNFDAIRMEKAIKSYFEAKLGKSEVEIRALLGSQEFYDDGVKATICFTGNKIGATNLLIQFKKGDQVVKRYHVPVFIKVQKEMLVYSQDLRAGDELSSFNLSYNQVFTSQEYILKKSDLIGYKLKRNVNEGKIVEEPDIEPAKVIKSGDLVELVVANSKVKVTSKAKALNAAAIGEKVRLERKGSNKLLEGIALQDGTVLIK